MEFNSSTRIYRKIKKYSESRLTIWYTSDVNTSCGNVSTDKESHFTLLRDTKKRQFPTSETRGRMGTSICCSDLWDRFGGQASVMIGRVDGIKDNH